MDEQVSSRRKPPVCGVVNPETGKRCNLYVDHRSVLHHRIGTSEWWGPEGSVPVGGV